MDVNEKSNWVPIGLLSPVVCALAIAIAVATATTVPTVGVGLILAGEGVAFLGCVYLYAFYLRQEVEQWRRESGQPDSRGADAMKGLHESGVRDIALIVPAVGMLFSAPFLIIVGVGIAAVSALI